MSPYSRWQRSRNGRGRKPHASDWRRTVWEGPGGSVASHVPDGIRIPSGMSNGEHAAGADTRAHPVKAVLPVLAVVAQRDLELDARPPRTASTAAATSAAAKTRPRGKRVRSSSSAHHAGSVATITAAGQRRAMKSAASSRRFSVSDHDDVGTACVR